jgi:hypothetical protein
MKATSPRQRGLRLFYECFSTTRKPSTSLLKQLGVQHQLKFLDTKPKPEPARPGVITRRWNAGLAVIELGPSGTHYKAPLTNDRPGSTYGGQLFRNWWQRVIMKDMNRVPFTRQEFVLFMAHKVGRVHVDPEIAPHFQALTQLNSLGFVRLDDGGKPGVGVPATLGDEPMGNPIPANVRQITYEVERTLTEQSSDLLSMS